MKRTINVVTVLLFAVLFLAGNTEINAKTENAELQKVFTDAIEAVGGKDAISKINSIEVFAECVGPKGKYTTAINSFRTNKTHFKQTFTYKDKITNVFINDKFAWEADDKTNEFSIVSPFQKLVVNLHEYQKMSFDFQKMFSGFELFGDEIFNEKPSVKVSAKNNLGGTIHLFFDKESKLLAGYILPIPDSDESVKNVFNEWKIVKGVKLPVVVTATDKEGDWVLRFNKLTLNKADEKTLNIPPRVEDLTELLRLHKEHQTAHLTYNAELFVESFAENLVTVQRGEAVTRNKAENLKRIKSYFGSFKFSEWEDVKPPVIKISKDGTLATIIVEKLVKGTYETEKGETITDVTEFAWLEVWEKIDGKWKIITVASTRKPTDDKK
jgi:hypothetical protein